MRRSLLLLLAIASLGTAEAATRPHYGGVVRAQTAESRQSLDPSAGASSALAFETLVRVDSDGRPQPYLAKLWQASQDNRRWQFWLRPGAKAHDGAELTLGQVAEALAKANPQWRTEVVGESVVIGLEQPRPKLPAELAQSQYGIAVESEGKLIGTGPFRVAEFLAGKSAVLEAFDEHWAGRPYVDRVVLEMGRPLRVQVMEVELGKADVAEIAPDQVRRAQSDGSRRVVVSAPVEVVALVASDASNAKLREALALAIDRATICNVLLQGECVPAGSLLPQWMSGYSFLFPAEPDVREARAARAETNVRGTMTLAYDGSDALARAISERVAVNARDAGLVLRLMSEGEARKSALTPDLRLARIRLQSGDGAVALSALAAELELPYTQRAAMAGSPEELYQTERVMLADFRVIPLLHIPEAHVLNPRVRNWIQPRTGGWPLAGLWVDGGR